MLFIRWQVIAINRIFLEVPIIIDAVRMVFLFRVSTIACAVLVFSKRYIGQENFFLRFHLILLIFVTSIILLILSPNLIRVLLGWDGLGVTSYLLVVYFQSHKSFNAGLLTALRNRVGDVLILITIVFLLSQGSWNFSILSLEKLSKLDSIITSLIVLAACTKRAQIPFSAWLPAAIAAPTPVSSLVHSSTLVTAGVYLLVRFNWALNNCSGQFYILRVGSLTILIAGLAAIGETDIKKIVALSTLRQLGLIIRAIGLGFPQIAFFHLLTHAYFKALLFISVGNIIHLSRDYQDLRKIGLLPRLRPVTLRFSLLANLRLCGLPFIAGFYSKDIWLEIRNLLLLSPGISFLFYLATAATAIYTTRFIILTLWATIKTSLLWSEDSDPHINLSIFILSPLAIIGGRGLRWTLLSTSERIYLPLEIKNLTLLVIFSGAFLGAFCTLNLQNPQFEFKWSLFQIWSLPLITTPLLQKNSLAWGKFFRSQVDLNWVPLLTLRPIKSRNSLTLSDSTNLLVSNRIYRLVLILVILRLLIYLHIFNFLKT